MALLSKAVLNRPTSIVSVAVSRWPERHGILLRFNRRYIGPASSVLRR